MDTQIHHLSGIIDDMRAYFDSGATMSIDLRKSRLEKLFKVIERNSAEICKALFEDFHKPEAEVLITEIYPVLAEIKHTLRNISNWAKPRSVSTNFLLLPSNSKIYAIPQGLVVIFSPWNYSLWLSMMPLISAIAAGNVVILKPAHETPRLSALIVSLIASVFDKEHVHVVLGNGAETGALLLENFEFDHIFFTGSARVGKWVMEKAARNLTPVTLELGGKSPSIIDNTYDLNKAARKIIWGKIINAGQTCVSTDYVLVPRSRVEAFTAACIQQIKALAGEDVFTSKNYCHIINDQRFARLTSLLEGCTILYGGKHDEKSRCIEPTLVIPPSMEHIIMQEEIFGPILPIITYESKEDLLSIIRRNRYPLALYMFVDDPLLRDFVLSRIEFGSGCTNNTIYQLGNPNLPFGGIRSSGFGRYHGKTGFDNFSNLKSMLQSPKWFDPSLLYQPYTRRKLELFKRFFMR